MDVWASDEHEPKRKPFWLRYYGALHALIIILAFLTGLLVSPKYACGDAAFEQHVKEQTKCRHKWKLNPDWKTVARVLDCPRKRM